MTRIVVDKATLKRHRACRAAYTSPEWDEKLQALVFNDWDKTVARLLAKGQEGVDQLEWWVRQKLVPMTAEEFAKIKKEHSNG
jgi:hypothetical protein